ncbi:MAG TPA: hypothetical protein VK653_05705, partial [Xanthobacteraceae bacterium]|nr:hypothetical protein [Xanthobacteraceae bacterium]
RGPNRLAFPIDGKQTPFRWINGGLPTVRIFSNLNFIFLIIMFFRDIPGLVDREVIDQQMRSPQALTMALLGLMSEDCLIRQKLAKAVGKHRKAA